MRWLEPACGSGRFLRVIAGRGGVVYGFDRSEAMVAYARRSLERRGLRGRIWADEMDAFTMPGRARGGAGAGTEAGGGVRAHMAFNLINTVRHLTSDESVLAHLACVAGALRRGGVYALGLNLTAYGAERESEDVWVGRRGACEVTQVVQYLPPERRRRRERVINHLTVVTPRLERHLDNQYDLRAYSGMQWRRLLGASAMTPIGVVDEDGRDHGTVREWLREGMSGYGIWVLRPRSG
jgi:SAM-dependent methyltransferase